MMTSIAAPRRTRAFARVVPRVVRTMNGSSYLSGPFRGAASEVTSILWGIASLVSMGASAYHGAKRHGGSIGWGVWWGVVGGVFPVLTPAVAAAQGFGKCKFKCGR